MEIKFFRQMKLVFSASCREKRRCDALVLRSDLSYLGDSHPRYQFIALYLSFKAHLRAFQNAKYSLSQIAFPERGVATPTLRGLNFETTWSWNFLFCIC